MTTDQARRIILHAVTVTKPRWSEYGVWWKDSDRIFLTRACQQGGFEVDKFLLCLEKVGIGTIIEIGRILVDQRRLKTKYEGSYAGALDAPFWLEMAHGNFGLNGRKFARCENISDRTLRQTWPVFLETTLVYAEFLRFSLSISSRQSFRLRENPTCPIPGT